MALTTAQSVMIFFGIDNHGRSDGGYIGIYPPKSVYLKFFMWLFCLLDPGQIRYRAIYTHPNQIPGYASVDNANSFLSLKLIKILSFSKCFELLSFARQFPSVA